MQRVPESSRTAPDSSRAGVHSGKFQSSSTYSAFLRSAMADEESIQLSENLQHLAQKVEVTMALLQPPDADVQAVAQALVGLVDDVRAHRSLLLALGGDWHHFFEFDAHFVAVNQFRIALTRWAMQAAPPEQVLPLPSDFDLTAWRVLGAGAMLLDVYEQSKAVEHVHIVSAPAPAPVVARTWWERLRAWVGYAKWPRGDQRKPGRRGRRATD